MQWGIRSNQARILLARQDKLAEMSLCLSDRPLSHTRQATFLLFEIESQDPEKIGIKMLGGGQIVKH